MKRFNIIAILLLALIWSGCSVSKDVSLPNVVPGLFRNTIQKDSSSVGDLPLKSFINDLTVQHLIDTALAKNYDMQIALKKYRCCRSVVQAIKTGLFTRIKVAGCSEFESPI